MNITTLKGVLSRKFTGASIDDVEGISDYSLFKEAAANMVNEINPAETTRKTTLSVFEGVYDYSPPADFKGLVDIGPQAQRNVSDNPTRRFSEDFDTHKNNNDFTIEWRDATKILRYSKSVGNSESIHTMDSLTANGTWDGTAANISADTFNPYKGSASIKADYDTGEYIENDDFTAIDLSDHENQSTLFLAGYFPDGSLITNISLRWGSSSSAYFSRTATAPQFGSFANGWNLIPFDWNGATETGTVDTNAIDYLRITPTLSASDTDIKFDTIFSALPKVNDLLYYSKYLFRSSAGVWKETPTADSDLINLDTDAENLFVYECVRLIAIAMQGRGEIYITYTNMLYGTPQVVGMYARYKTRNPDEPIQPQSQHRTFRWTKK